MASTSMKMLVPAIIEQYMNKCSLSWEIALERLYKSFLYNRLENTEVELSDLSPSHLCDLLIEEYDAGSVQSPEVQ